MTITASHEDNGLDTQSPATLPPRNEIAGHYLIDEARLLSGLIERAFFSASEKRNIESLARQLVHAARAGRRQYGGVDAFMTEYGLSTEEGIILMCLAEALLRIPDAGTADDLIDDKISSGDWQRHLGHSGSTLVNASTWGLMLTGKVISLKDGKSSSPTGLLKRIVGRSGEPVIRQAMRHAMRILGDQFVLGRNINEAIKRAAALEEQGYTHSYDMLGEAARTAPDAERYFERYLNAIEAVAKAAGPSEDTSMTGLMKRPGLSIKLSAIHPRFEAGKIERVRRELGTRLSQLLQAARDANLSITIDAEEQDRLDLTLQVFADALSNPALAGWNGFGIVIQAYSKRALPSLRWLRDLARDQGHVLPVRLVKGAYWDTEIKFAQEQGLPDYPVFTRKSNTDVSYIACARLLLSEQQYFYPQFATHNAHTIAALQVIAADQPFEYQRLHGMGEALYEEVLSRSRHNRSCRIYAPTGGHEDLLAYLVRRLLENGANTSFVNRLADDELPVADIIQDPVARAEDNEPKRHPGIALPLDLYEPKRRNSLGLPIWERHVRDVVYNKMEAALALPLSVGPIVNGRATISKDAPTICAPHDRGLAIGTCTIATDEDVDTAINSAAEAQHDWDRLGGAARADILEKAADLYEQNREQLMAVIIREAGKTLANAQGDVREAADFLYYYASQARTHFEGETRFHSPTGEHNVMTMHGRGVFGCISPWNFPLAIFTGQIAGALAAGNCVVAKPAEQTPMTAFVASQMLIKAGVPTGVFHLLPGGGAVGARIVSNTLISGIAFTGSNETASHIQATLAARGGPIVPFVAETGGLNAMIVDSSALPEQVVRDVVMSAFDSSGQRCSALRVLFLQEDIADNTLEMLVGATQELTMGDPFDYATDLGPVIDEAAEDMLNSHKVRMQTEGKLICDLPMPDNCRQGTFVTPAIYQIDSISQLEREVFGPILHVIRYRREDLDKVCQDINATGYGLTLGLHSRIESTADYIGERVRVGNYYVNRNQVGAVVGVQPFGGEGLSGTGPKAGGPHYLHAFATERVRTTDITANGGNTELLSLEAFPGHKPN